MSLKNNSWPVRSQKTEFSGELNKKKLFKQIEFVSAIVDLLDNVDKIP